MVFNLAFVVFVALGLVQDQSVGQSPVNPPDQHLVFDWNGKSDWWIVKRVAQSWGEMTLVAPIDGDETDRGLQIKCIRFDSGTLEKLTSDLVTMKQQMQPAFPDIELETIAVGKRSAKQAVILVMQTGEPDGDLDPKTVLTLAFQGEHGVHMVQVMWAQGRVEQSVRDVWVERFQSARIAEAPLITRTRARFGDELERLAVNAILVKASKDIVGPPVWSPNGMQLAVRMGDRWRSIHLDALLANKDQWMGHEIARVERARETWCDDDEIAVWAEKQKARDENQSAADGTGLSLVQRGSGTAIVLQPSQGEPRDLWVFPNHKFQGLVTSPNGRYTTFAIDGQAVVVMQVPRHEGKR